MQRKLALLVLAASLLAPTIAFAACADDVRDLKVRLQREEKRDKAKAAAVRRELRPVDAPVTRRRRRPALRQPALPTR
jgi:hypothetical protein